MTKSELINRLSKRNDALPYKGIEQAVNSIFEHLSSSLEKKDRIEVRGFGSYNLREHDSRNCRNPKTGEALQTDKKTVIRFKPSKELRERANNKRHPINLL